MSSEFSWSALLFDQDLVIFSDLYHPVVGWYQSGESDEACHRGGRLYIDNRMVLYAILTVKMVSLGFQEIVLHTILCALDGIPMRWDSIPPENTSIMDGMLDDEVCHLIFTEKN